MNLNLLMENIKKIPLFYKISLILFIIFIIIYSYCLYNKKNLLTTQKKKELFKNNNNNKFNMYYVNWCQHCVKAKPEFKKLIDNNKHNVSLNMIDCEKNPEEAEKNNIEGYPTFILKKNNENIIYNNERTYSAFKKFLNQHL